MFLEECRYGVKEKKTLLLTLLLTKFITDNRNSYDDSDNEDSDKVNSDKEN